MFPGEINPDSLSFNIYVYNKYFWMNLSELYDLISPCFI